ncbi:MAG TPA: 30S ribosomal protein S6 [Chitinivibrionales bacterium]|nr:30S ribosomal protein S6 [Chitinivibrionales bacterium]
MKRPYESVVIFDATLPEITIHGENAKLEEFFRKNAAFEKTVVMGKKMLAYPIRKKKTGIFHLYLYSGEGDVAGKLEKHLKLNETVLRHLSVGRVPGTSRLVEASTPTEGAQA